MTRDQTPGGGRMIDEVLGVAPVMGKALEVQIEVLERIAQAMREALS
jgi:hypothetical protein